MRAWLLRHFTSRLHPRPPRVEIKGLPLPIDKIRAIKGPLTKVVESTYYVGYGDGVSEGTAIGIEIGAVGGLVTGIAIAAIAFVVWQICSCLAWFMLPRRRKGRALARFVVTLLIFGTVVVAFACGADVKGLVVWVVKSMG